jgi:TolB-like protein
VPNGAAVDSSGERLIFGAQLVTEPRGGTLAGRNAPARPEDLRRDNVLMPYNVSSGISADPIKTNEFEAERIALGPGACFAFFTSFNRNQPRLHVWGLVEQGDDLARLDLQERVAVIAVATGGHLAVAVSETGHVRTWRLSGATTSDCDAYTKKPQATGPTITLGPETEPLIKSGTGARIAVLRFDATGVDAGLGDAVAEMVAGQMSNSPQVTVVERGAINSILKELELQRSGLTAADAVKIGRGLNARKVLFGGVRRFGESTYVISARVVDVETQQVEGSREVTCESCKEQDLPRAVSALRRTIVP